MICFEHFSFRYEESKEFTLKDINLTVETGEFILLTGRSGSGLASYKLQRVFKLLRVHGRQL